MAEADCSICEAMGFRSCDLCGNPVYPNGRGSAFGLELCELCAVQGVAQGSGAEGPAASGASGPAATESAGI